MSKSTDGDTRGSKRCKWTEVSSSSPFAAFERVQTLPVPDQIAVRRQAFELRFDEKGNAQKSVKDRCGTDIPKRPRVGRSFSEHAGSSRDGHVVFACGSIRPPAKFSARFALRFHSSSRPLLSLLFHEDEAHGHEDEIKDKQLGALAVRGAYISLKN